MGKPPAANALPSEEDMGGGAEDHWRGAAECKGLGCVASSRHPCRCHLVTTNPAVFPSQEEGGDCIIPLLKVESDILFFIRFLNFI